MRFLEITLILTNIIVLFLPRSNRRYAAVVLIAIALLHIGIEQVRWQMTPVYLVVAITVLYFLLNLQVDQNWIGTIGTIFAILLLMTGGGIGRLFPVIRLARLTGPHQIGSMILHLVDEERDEIYSAEPNDKRELIVTIWYPASVTNEKRAPYLPNPSIGAPSIAAQFELPPFILTHSDLVKTRSYLDAPAADGRYPVVFFSHGLGGIRGQNTQMVEELASQGYIVVSADHAYASAYTVFPDDRVVPRARVIEWDTPRENETTQQLVSVWAEDLRFILRQLDQFDREPSHILSGHMQLDQVGVFGHSTGGGTAFEFCYREPRCAATLGLDPWVIPNSDAAVAEGLSKPMVILRAPEGLSEINLARLNLLYEASGDRRGHWVIEETGHYDYTDFKLLSPALAWVGMTGSIDEDAMRDILDRTAVTLFDAALKGKAWERLAAVSAEFPSISTQD